MRIPRLLKYSTVSRRIDRLSSNGMPRIRFFVPCPEHVVVNAEIIDQRQVLVHGRNTHGAGLDRRAQVDRLAVEGVGAAIGLVKAAENLDQRGFARAVVPHQPKHLAAMQA